MATTKTLLEKAMLKAGAEGSAPTKVWDRVTLTFASSGDSYIVPCDGYIFAEGLAEVSSKGYVGILRTDTADSREGEYGFGLKLFTRVTRGETIKAEFVHMGSLTYWFKKSIGGGYKAIKAVLRSGGAVWLRLKNCLKAQSILPLQGRTQKLAVRCRLISHLRHMEGIFGVKTPNGYRQTMDGLWYTLITFIESSLGQVLKQSDSIPLQTKRVIRSLSRRVKLQPLAHRQVQDLQGVLRCFSALKIKSLALEGGY